MISSDTTDDSARAEERAHPLRAFLTELARHPRQMGTVWPSSRILARAMVRRLPDDSTLSVLELGPGTGVVTQALLARGLSPRRLVAVEKSPRLTEVLRRRFPGVRILTGDALELGALLGGEQFGAVVSSLPLKVFSAPDVVRLADAIRALLHPGGRWIQYTYQLLNGYLPTSAFRRVTSDLVLRNFPPALVCVYQPINPSA
jgi:phospholipid N-methyltransferase